VHIQGVSSDVFNFSVKMDETNFVTPKIEDKRFLSSLISGISESKKNISMFITLNRYFLLIVDDEIYVLSTLTVEIGISSIEEICFSVHQIVNVLQMITENKLPMFFCRFYASGN